MFCLMTKLTLFRGAACRAFLFALLLVVVACSTTDFVTGKSTRNNYVVDEDIQLGTQVLQQSIAEMKKAGVPVDHDTRRLNLLRDMVKRIGAISHMPTLPYEVHLLETNIVNAMCAPGGKVMVFSGLYDPKVGLVKDEAELAAVLGHEIAHATCRHTTESLTRQAPVNALLLIAGLVAEARGNDEVALAIGAGFVLYNGVWVPKYSRVDEAEADRVGLMYMAKAGYDPRAAPRLWKRACEREGNDSALAMLFSTHPSNKARWKELEKRLPEALAAYAQATGRRVEDLRGDLPIGRPI
jgi:metalloendopeptidase OMA1, mitochondrial